METDNFADMLVNYINIVWHRIWFNVYLYWPSFSQWYSRNCIPTFKQFFIWNVTFSYCVKIWMRMFQKIFYDSLFKSFENTRIMLLTCTLTYRNAAQTKYANCSFFKINVLGKMGTLTLYFNSLNKRTNLILYKLSLLSSMLICLESWRYLEHDYLTVLKYPNSPTFSSVIQNTALNNLHCEL